MSAMPRAQHTTVGFAPSTERRQAVLLGTEIRGLARLSEALEPSLVLHIANEFFCFTADVVTAHGGEAVMPQHELLLSVFTRGSPMQTAQQAVRAAQRSASRPISRRWRRSGAPATACAARSPRACTWAKWCSAAWARAAWNGAPLSATASAWRNAW